MKEGNLPSRDGSQTDVNYNHETKMIRVEINGEKQELPVIEALNLAGLIIAMTQVVLSNGE
jgi:hypothetical protein